MRLQVTLRVPERITLPWNYPERLMAFIYRLLLDETPEWASWLHARGFQSDGKQFKLFTFSRLEGRRPRATERGLELVGPVRWRVSSPVPEFIVAFGGRLLAEGWVRAGPVRLQVASVERRTSPRFIAGRVYRLRTLSPVVASTGERDSTGRLQKRFLTPSEPDFARVLAWNLARKRAALAGGPDASPLPIREPNVQIRVAPGFRSRLWEVHGTRIRGWELTLEMGGDPELLSLAYAAGLGEHNAAGFGMLELLE